MEQVFDLREFIVAIFIKFKLVLIMAVVLGILGGAYGFLKEVEDEFTTTSSLSVNIEDKKLSDATALTSVMTSIKDTVAGDYFYTGILSSIRESVDTNEFDKMFDGKQSPSIEQLKEVVKVYVNGNLVLIDVTSTQESLSVEASEAGTTYIMEQLGKNINNIDIMKQGHQTINTTLQKGETQQSNGIKFLLVGFAGGMGLAILWVLFIDIMSLKIRSAADLKKYNMPILGEIKKG